MILLPYVLKRLKQKKGKFQIKIRKTTRFWTETMVMV